MSDKNAVFTIAVISIAMFMVGVIGGASMQGAANRQDLQECLAHQQWCVEHYPAADVWKAHLDIAADRIFGEPETPTE